MKKPYYILVGKFESKDAPYEMIFGDYVKSVVDQEKADTDTDQYKQMRVVRLEIGTDKNIHAKLAELNG